MEQNTICVQGGYTPGNGEPRQIPIIQSTTFKYDTSEDMGKLFDLEAEGYFTRDCRIRPMTMWQQRLPSWRAVQRQCLPAADRQPISLPSLISAEQGITLYLRPVSMAELTI